MERGYVKLWRKTADSGLLHNPEVFTFFAWALMKATHKPYSHLVGTTMVDLVPGQFVTGINAAALDLKSTPRKIRTALVTLEKLQILTRKTTNKFSIITIVNWDTYQPSDKQGDKHIDKQATSKRQAGDNKQELKNKEHKKEPKPPSGFDEFWQAYPKKVGKGAAVKSWKKQKPDLQTVLDALDWQTRSDQWTKDGGQFIPNPTTYLNQQRWEDEYQPNVIAQPQETETQRMIRMAQEMEAQGATLRITEDS